VQLKPGKLRGFIKHFGIGSLEISLGRYNSGARIRGILDRKKVVLATILESAGRITQWWNDVAPGSVVVFPPSVEFDGIHAGGTFYCAVSIPLPELSSMLGGEGRLSEPEFWQTRRMSSLGPLDGARMRQRLIEIVSGIERRIPSAPREGAGDFFKRSILEPFVTSLANALPPRTTRSATGARLVRETEDFIDGAGRPVHISELSSALNVSRRSLHRAFADTLGIGPAAYLRSRRLSAVRSALVRSDPAAVSIGDLAFEHGFAETGRFAAYYRAHFGETPSETLRSSRLKKK